MTALIKSEEKQFDILGDLEQTQKLCAALMKTPHYQKIGEVGIYALVNKAKSMGMNPLDALNGGMYFVQGKVEMSGQAMLALIRSKGHSVSMDPKSTNTHVRMFGKRADNSDSWSVEFSIDDAKRAGIYKNTWEKYPKTMCTWRCVSMLGRFLFSDILHGVYVQGEISELSINATMLDETKIQEMPTETVEEIKLLTPSHQAVKELQVILDLCSPEYQTAVNERLEKLNIHSLDKIPLDMYVILRNRASEEKKKFIEKSKKELDAISPTSTDEVLDAQQG